MGGPHDNCKQTLGILWMMSCNSSWRISAERLFSESWMHPRYPHQHLGEILWETGILMWEVTFPRRGGWVPPEQPFWPPAPTKPDGGWEPREQPPHPPAPVQPNEDVRHLINTLATGLQCGTPHINTFSGNAMPGKMEVSFEQWYHKVQCVKDHYLESVVRESNVHSLKGAVVDMARYIGPTTSMTHILQKLTIIFSTVVLFDMLIQNLYKVTQSNHEKVPSFATRLEGTLNQIRLQCLRRITDQEVQKHLKDYLFHGVWKHIRDSICYLYSNPGTI